MRARLVVFTLIGCFKVIHLLSLHQSLADDDDISTTLLRLQDQIINSFNSYIETKRFHNFRGRRP
jgi:hypothetical protein